MPHSSILTRDLLHPEPCIHIKHTVTADKLFADSWKIPPINAYGLSNTCIGQI